MKSKLYYKVFSTNFISFKFDGINCVAINDNNAKKAPIKNTRELE